MRPFATAGIVACMCVLGGSVTPAHDGPHWGPDDEAWTVNKNGEVKIALDAVIGGIRVRQGKYAVEHRVDGSAHTLVLTGLSRRPGESRMIHEIPVRFIPFRDAVTKSAFFVARQPDRSWRIDHVQIAGESGDHVPDLLVEAVRAGA